MKIVRLTTRSIFVFSLLAILFVFVGCNQNTSETSDANADANTSAATTPTSTNEAYKNAASYEKQYNEPTTMLPVLSDAEKEKVFAIAEGALGSSAKATSAVAGPYASGVAVYQVSVHFQEKLYEVVINKETFEIIDTIFRADL